MNKWYNYLIWYEAGDGFMKKILSIIPVLMVLGGFLVSDSEFAKEQPKQEASAHVYTYMSDPGGW
ncbi:hypothetical protein J7E43_08285 [Bacillus sp. ISL-8]|nr:hypothetical protein [Bacillus sp. ISL-8]